ncbi:MAG: iron complex outerrane recepter protein [Sphingomonadales bacterium]|jgi:outer membrane receptor protein involved in Fe transport|nr:iron complex outerrane recepter protein [Sphingomonadales bacterium]
MSHLSATSHRRAAYAGAASLLAIALSTPAFAQDAPAQPTADNGEVIIVTATKRETSLLEVPFSINAQTEAMIERSGANTIEDLSRNVAGLTIQNLGPGQSQVSVRGVSAGQIVRDQPGVKEQVGVYLDESVISLSLFTPDIDLYDLNRVETLRGPQGTLFGSGSVGGTIRYITNQPDMNSLSGSVEANLNLLEGGDIGGHLKGMINAPLGTGVALRAVGYYTEYGGFIDARREGGVIDENVNGGHRAGGRLSVALEPGEGIRITPRILYQEIRANGFNRQEVYNLYANPFTTTRPPVTFGEREQHLLLRESFSDDTLLADLNVEIDLGEDVSVTSISTYINRDIVVSRDASALTHSVSLDLNYGAGALLIPSNLVDTTDLETFAQEIRLATSSAGPFNFVAGLFYSGTDRFYRQRLPTPGYDAFTDARFGAGTSAAVANGFPLNSPYNADLPYDIKQYAAFGEATWDISPRLHLTAGGRVYDFSETRRFKSGGLFSNGDNNINTTSSTGFSPRAILSYEMADNIRVNAQASKGFRLGGVNDPLNIPLCTGGANGIDARTYGNRPTYEDETLWNYELGVRGQRRGLNFAAAAFYTDISNLQVTADAGSCSSRVVFNVPKSHTMGVEAEISVTPVTGLSLSINGSLLEAKFDSDVTTTAGVVIAGIRDGNRLPTVPNFQLSANASYSFPVADGASAFVGASVQHVGSRYTQPSDQENNPRNFVSGLAFGGATGNGVTRLDLRLPAYDYVNLSAGVDWDNGLGAMIYVTNLFDENALLSFDRERGGRARLGFNVGQPRTIGITLRKRFRAGS